MMHRAHGQQGVDGKPVLNNGAVGQHDHNLAGAHGDDGLMTDPFKGIPQSQFHGIVEINHLVGVILVLYGKQLPKLAFGQHRRVDEEARAVFWRRFKQVPLATKTGLERHHDMFAQRINGRISDLGELLTEGVIEGTRMRGQHR